MTGFVHALVVDEPIDSDDFELMTTRYAPCEECGETGPCGYDHLGRPMMHMQSREDEVIR